MADDDRSRSSRRRTIAGTSLVAVLAVALVAIVVVRSGGEKVLNENGDPLVLVGATSDDPDADETGLDAVLADVGGCLGTRDDGVAAGSRVVIWPHGTTIETPEPLRIRVDGTVYGIGDRIGLEGGPGTIEPSDAFHDRVPEACRTATVFVATGS